MTLKSFRNETRSMSDNISLLSLFIGSFLAATLLPGGSEALLFGVLRSFPETQWAALLIATAGNTIGGMVSFCMGWLLPQRNGSVKADGCECSPRPLPQTDSFAGNLSKVSRYGMPVLLLAWVPLIGDALCLAAGWLRLNPWQAALFMAIGKFARYWVVAFAAI